MTLILSKLDNIQHVVFRLILIFVPFMVTAQSSDKNYIRTITYKVPNSSSNSNPDSEVANVQISYFDGLGRPIQQIAHKQSNTGKDIVTHFEYDAFGRQTKEFLPYISSGSSLNYISSAASEVASFYTSANLANTGNPNFETTLYPYSEKALENSPLDRVLKQAAPGNPWKMGSGNEIKFEYLTNKENEVKYFKVIANWNATNKLYEPAIVSTGYYNPNQLYKTITKDENWKVFSDKNNTTEEFKDKSGKVVLKRTYNNGDKHDTYYIYDQYGNLTYVIPPLADGVANPTILNNLGYQYKYDNRNRLVEKKLPGKQWEYIVYDKVDQPVATGPAFSPYGDGSVGWMITQYDVYGRVTQTGWKQMTVDQNERSNMQTIINTGNNPFTLTASEVLSKNFYDNYDFSGAPSNLPSLIENQTRATNVKGLPTGSWVKVLDNASSSTTEVSYTLYDYKYRPVHTKTTNHLGDYTQIDTHLDWAGKTLYTQTKHKRIADDTEIVVKDIFQYNLQDKLVVHKQQINQLPEQLITKNTYDELGQLISKNVGGSDITGATGLQKVDYSYNIRGWLKQINNVTNMETDNDLFAFKINYNDTETATPLFNGNISETFWKTTTDNIQRKYKYTYDNLNRLLKADYSKEGNTEFNSYLEHLSYDKNGNIKSLVRNGAMDTDGMQFENPIDNLTYLYDDTNKNQLLRVFDSTANPQGFSDDSDGISDTEDDYAYDDNGNMTHDDNKGITHITYNHLNLPVEIIFGTYGKIAYLYNATGQKLKKTVTEGTTITTTDYLSGFQYKNLVLQFFPHAEGYVNATEEMVVMGGTSYRFNYVFNYTDHLGNIRLSYSLDPSTKVLKIIEENHYYPFGLKHSGYNSDKMMYTKEAEVLKIKPVPPLFITSYKYKYNGKEWQDELGLNMYDYGARNYDPALGRWFSIDPLAEVSRRWSTYTYCYDNPIVFVDPDGMLATPPIDYFDASGNKIGTDGNQDDKRKFVVTNESDVDKISKANKKGETTKLTDVTSANQLPSDTALKESLNVLKRTTDNGGKKEESSLVMKEGTIVQGKQGPEAEYGKAETASASLPNVPTGKTDADVEASIHSHPTKAEVIGEKVYSGDATVPGPNDPATFVRFGTNIIVGPLGKASGSYQTNSVTGQQSIVPSAKPNGVVIYNNSYAQPLQLSQKAVEKIIK